VSVLERNIHASVASAEDLRWFRGYLQGILDSGDVAPEELRAVLTRVHKRFRDTGEEAAADLALDGLDFLTGWSGPGMRIEKRETA
jgi:hypothetical protein